MGKATNAKLTLTRLPGNMIKIDVQYDAVFNEFERHLVGLGLRFLDRIAVIGVDPAGSTTGTVVTHFPNEPINVTDGIGSQTVPCFRTMQVSRAVLDEDFIPNVNPDVDADEIRCRIRVFPVGFPSNNPVNLQETFTNQAVLGLIAGQSVLAEE